MTADLTPMPRRQFLARGAAAIGAVAAVPLLGAERVLAGTGHLVGKGELGLVGMDHVGITVPDLNQAIEWFEDILGAVAPLIGVVGTLAGARLGFRASREQLEKTLAEQHFRSLNERFTSAADQLGDDKSPAVRLAGVYAMAALADDWEESRQRCIDVLCAYMRLPYDSEPNEGVSRAEMTAQLGNREVRQAVLRVIGNHLRTPDPQASRPVSWSGMDFDFTGAVFDGGDFSYADFTGSRVSFIEAVFAGTVYFEGYSKVPERLFQD